MAETTQQQVLFSAFCPPPSAFYYGRSNNEPPRFSAWQSGMAIGACKIQIAADSASTELVVSSLVVLQPLLGNAALFERLGAEHS
ncbi:MAG: hypothetical protein ACFE0I_01065 [Elainellaceae cyanobacterium]